MIVDVWNSKYEVESGMLIVKQHNLVPTLADDVAEQAAMRELHGTYGKTWHLWQGKFAFSNRSKKRET